MRTGKLQRDYQPIYFDLKHSKTHYFYQSFKNFLET